MLQPATWGFFNRCTAGAQYPWWRYVLFSRSNAT